MGIQFNLGGRRRSVTSLGSGRAVGKGTGCFVMLFAVPFFCAGMGVLFFFALRPLYLTNQAKGWEEVQAIVTASEVRSSRSSDGTTYNLHLVYQYTYENRQYESDRYDFVSIGTDRRSGFDRIVEENPVGQEITAYVNPDRPHEAVVNPGFPTHSLWLGLFGLIFAGVGSAVFIFGIVTFRSAGRLSRGGPGESEIKPSGEIYAAKTIPEPRVPDANGRVNLEPESKAMGQFIGLLIFTLFWNGIVSVFLFHWLSERSGGNPQYGMLLFLMPFVLVGIGALIGTVYTFMALFNPKVKIWISPGRARPGQTFTIGWVFEGSVNRLENFTITLEGLERATYRQGTRTYTAEHTFHKLELFSSEDRLTIASGSTQVTLPMEAIHSFSAPNNQIIWRFHVAGKIHRWPDLKAGYPFVLLPPLAQS